MSRVSLAIGHPTLVDRIFQRELLTDLVLIFAGACVTGIAAQVQVPLWPVPLTGQTLAVLLIGSLLGALRGAMALSLYAGLGSLGLPVFSNASSGISIVLGPTGGYIIGFIFAAAFVGWIAQRSWDRTPLRCLVALCGATFIIYLIGLPWLALSLKLTLVQALEGGLYPLLLGAALKILVATGIIMIGWNHIQKEDKSRAIQELASR